MEDYDINQIDGCEEGGLIVTCENSVITDTYYNDDACMTEVNYTVAYGVGTCFGDSIDGYSLVTAVNCGSSGAVSKNYFSMDSNECTLYNFTASTPGACDTQISFMGVTEGNCGSGMTDCNTNLISTSNICVNDACCTYTQSQQCTIESLEGQCSGDQLMTFFGLQILAMQEYPICQDEDNMQSMCECLTYMSENYPEFETLDCINGDSGMKLNDMDTFYCSSSQTTIMITFAYLIAFLEI